ncbi:RimJ/RimL family protein N-acetyltransferase [Cytobacillus eiseniae]|uniref:RimJ/RimL family protein N-acetyltransferase n=1 Tax=Cytobacillus eiseniae TaxID=762947 RepID=A0ABS4REB3_9BACI|nr:GNAT family protein [Cytobacillus eiseniae]MBP2240716.1 RimJ/RimL family protein N-acetyltransferase [Cytobacillus eiseniae]
MYTYIEFNQTMADELVEFLTSETWSFHGQENPTEESIRKNVANGFYNENGNQTFWIVDNHSKIGIIRIFDLDDPICLFDLRLKKKVRGKGMAKHVLHWLSAYVFNTYTHIIRIEGHTRSDNLAMRKTFFNSGFVKEAYNRRSWRQSGQLFDSVGYAMIREDWENNTKTIVDDHFPY